MAVRNSLVTLVLCCLVQAAGVSAAGSEVAVAAVFGTIGALLFLAFVGVLVWLFCCRGASFGGKPCANIPCVL